MGCSAGSMENAFTYIKECGGIDSEASYPYEVVEKIRRFKSADGVVTCTGYIDIVSKDENTLQLAVVTISPILVVIDSSHASFQLYKHEVYNEPMRSQTQLDCAVLIVDYGVESGADY